MPSESLSGQELNINEAAEPELAAIPEIGPSLAKSIIDYRKKHGKFRKAEHLILVKKMSDRKFRKIRHLIRV